MTQDDVRTLIRGLERASWPVERWNHEAHLAMAVWYLTYLPRRQALRVIATRIASYNQAHAASHPELEYHETLTLFLAMGVGAFLDALPDELSFDARVQHALAAFRNWKTSLRLYYSADRLKGRGSRTCWAEPDRRPLRTWLRACEEMGAAVSSAGSVHLPMAAAG